MSSIEEQKVVLNAILENNTCFCNGPAALKTVLAVEAARQAAENKNKHFLLQPKP